LRLVKDAALCKELAEFEQKMMFRNYKFGVLLMKQDQKTEADLYCNQGGVAVGGWGGAVRLVLVLVRCGG
jgi:hypothetical protein